MSGGYAVFMGTPVRVKINVALALALVGALFVLAGRSLVPPGMLDGGMTFVFADQPGRLLAVTAGLVAVGTLLAMLVGRPYGRHIALLAGPAGLSTWAIMSGSMNRLLLHHGEVGDRARMFDYLVGDAALWSAMIVVGSVVTILAARTGGQAGLSGEQNDRREQKSKRTLVGGSRGKPSIMSGGGRAAAWLRDAFALVLSCVIAVVVLKVLLQSSLSRLVTGNGAVIEASLAPELGQVAFAVFTAFLLGTLGSHQLFGSRIGVFLAGPPIVAAIAYIAGAQEGVLTPLAGHSPYFVLSSMVWATVLPIQYIGFGSLAVIGGFWFSVRTSRLRRQGRSG